MIFGYFWDTWLDKITYAFSIRPIPYGNFFISNLCKNQAQQPKFARLAAKRKVQLLPGRIMTHNENPSLSRSRE